MAGLGLTCSVGDPSIIVQIFSWIERLNTFTSMLGANISICVCAGYCIYGVCVCVYSQRQSTMCSLEHIAAHVLNHLVYVHISYISEALWYNIRYQEQTQTI